MNDIVCISPVDGSEVARRRSATDAEVAAVLAGARKAQLEWSAVPLADRKVKMLDFLAAMQAQNDDIVPELAMQMGRPVRYGGEMRSLEERVRSLVELSDEALAPIVPAAKTGLRRMIKRMPAGIRIRDRSLELSLPDRRELHCPGPVGGQCGDPQTCRANGSGG